MAVAFRAAVGRDALIPPHPAAAQTPAGGYGIRPYDRRRACGQTGNRGANGIANLCRGRCLHRPGNPAAARGSPGGINPAPTNNFYVWANRGGRAVKTNGCRFPGGRRAGCPIPPHPAAAQTPTGGYGIRPYDRRKVRGQTGNPAAARTPTGGPWPSPTNRGGRLTNRETANPRGVANFCRGRCLHRPGNPVATQTPAGGYGIRPYDRRRACGQTGNRGANGIANLCRGRCLHRPGNPAVTQTPAGGINPAPTN